MRTVVRPLIQSNRSSRVSRGTHWKLVPNLYEALQTFVECDGWKSPAADKCS